MILALVTVLGAAAVISSGADEAPARPVAETTPSVEAAPAELRLAGSPPPVATTSQMPVSISGYFPPLSLVECLDQLRAIQRLIPPETVPTAQAEEHSALIIRRVQSIFNYLKFRDDLHTSLADYQWVPLGEEKVQNDPQMADADVFTYDPPVTRISALSLSVTGGDVYIHKLRVIDEKDRLRQEWDHTKRPVFLRSLLPRREVFHLWTRTTISRIEVSYSRATNVPTDSFPRVTIFGGITEKTEHIKTAMRHLQEVELAVRQTVANHAAEQAVEPAEWQDARFHLRKADEEIREYLESQDAENL